MLSGDNPTDAQWFPLANKRGTRLRGDYAQSKTWSMIRKKPAPDGN
jgi:hypothetical protein